MQRDFNRYLNGFGGQQQDPNNVNFNLNTFTKTAFENVATKSVVNQNELVRLAREGGLRRGYDGQQGQGEDEHGDTVSDEGWSPSEYDLQYKEGYLGH